MRKTDENLSKAIALFLENALREVKVKAIKEFLEKVEEKTIRDYWGEYCYVVIEDVESIAKEMIEESQRKITFLEE